MIGRATPFTINGNQTDTLRYQITSSKTEFTGPVDVLVDGIISGMDLNSGQPTADTTQTSYFLQTPANLVWAGAIEPLVFDNDTTIFLDSTQTSLNLITTSYNAILLSGNSPVEIAGGDSLYLLFRPTYITGVAPADYAVQLTLTGTSTDRAYNKTIASGQVTIGGDVYFNGGSVIPTVVLQNQQNVRVNMVIVRLCPLIRSIHLSVSGNPVHCLLYSRYLHG